MLSSFENQVLIRFNRISWRLRGLTFPPVYSGLRRNLVCLGSPSQGRSNSALMSSSATGKPVCNRSWDRLPVACSGVHPHSSSAHRFQHVMIAHIPDEDRIVCKMEQAGLLGSLDHLRLEFIAGPQKLQFHTASDRTEPGDKRPKQDEHYIVRNFGTCEIECMKRLSEVVI